MRKLWDSGIFELFLPDVKEGECYKFEIKAKGGLTFMKADPYAFGQQLRPDSASIVRDLNGFKWEDGKWMKGRASLQAEEKPINVYEIYLASSRNRQTEENSIITVKWLLRLLIM